MDNSCDLVEEVSLGDIWQYFFFHPPKYCSMFCGIVLQLFLHSFSSGVEFSMGLNGLWSTLLIRSWLMVSSVSMQRGGIFHVTTLIIPKQESTSSSVCFLVLFIFQSIVFIYKARSWVLQAADVSYWFLVSGSVWGGDLFYSKRAVPHSCWLDPCMHFSSYSSFAWWLN